MKTKLVYVLVSSKKDVYLEQFFVSSYSAKYHMPDCHITLLVDEVTKDGFTDIREKELTFVDELIAVPIDRSLSPKLRSRILKTSSRKYISGNFLFIDTDTIVAKPFPKDFFENLKGSIYACYDSHSMFKENPYRKMCLNHGKLLNWPIEEQEFYYNSGVLFVKDNNESRDFFDRWSENWLLGKEKGVFMDQPSFAKTNYEMNNIVNALDDVWNCEFKHGIKFFHDAYIIHYLFTNSFVDDVQPFAFKDSSVFNQIKKTGSIPPIIKEYVNKPSTAIPNLTTIVSGTDVPLVNSNIYRLMKKIYKHKLLFRIIDRISYSLS